MSYRDMEHDRMYGVNEPEPFTDDDDWPDDDDEEPDDDE